jgi:2,5-diamino-6-(ribosylamino)-4(3H)-pyrimidinone 5'-phosphate reductase
VELELVYNMFMNKPITTLFLLMSVDGKISTGDIDDMDIDKDFPNIVGVKEGLKQYYDIEQQTDLFSLNSGRVLAKVGVNSKTDTPEKTPVTFVVIDNQPHLNESGLAYLCQKLLEFSLGYLSYYLLQL